MDNCIECGGKIARGPNGSYCISCGLEYIEDPILPSIKKKVERYKIKIEKCNPHKYYNSNVLEDKKELGYSQSNPKVFLIRDIQKVWLLISEILPETEKDRIFENIKEFIFNLYEKDIPKTRDKELIIYSSFISYIDIEIKHIEGLDGEDNEFKISKFEEAREILNKSNPILYNKSQNFIGNELKKEAERKSLGEVRYMVMDWDIIDPTWKNIDKGDFYKLFEKRQYPMKKETIELWEKNIIKATFEFAQEYIKLRNQETYLKGEIPQTNKEIGLFCVCCYIVCKHNSEDYQPANQTGWARFFGISKRTFQSRYDEIMSFFNQKVQK